MFFSRQLSVFSLFAKKKLLVLGGLLVGRCCGGVVAAAARWRRWLFSRIFSPAAAMQPEQKGPRRA